MKSSVGWPQPRVQQVSEKSRRGKQRACLRAPIRSGLGFSQGLRALKAELFISRGSCSLATALTAEERLGLVLSPQPFHTPVAGCCPSEAPAVAAPCWTGPQGSAVPPARV